MSNEEAKKLEEFEENRKHEIPQCDVESGNYSEIKLNNKDTENLKDLLGYILKQLK
ncbi:hypothetical protein [Treponema sp.]|uniref:hypothetical protein n=1 Tax=Treponema sp. TaxID=166 RepID=UPI00298ECCEA|nr:hypothetical protein [Treponema sp.]MCQ2241031.1 hypothetical protein [Treponema sp.]